MQIFTYFLQKTVDNMLYILYNIIRKMKERNKNASNSKRRKKSFERK